MSTVPTTAASTGYSFNFVTITSTTTTRKVSTFTVLVPEIGKRTSRSEEFTDTTITRITTRCVCAYTSGTTTTTTFQCSRTITTCSTLTRCSRRTGIKIIIGPVTTVTTTTRTT
jgi:hypothetical protein